MGARQVNIQLQVQSDQSTFYLQPSCTEGIILVRACQAGCQITVARYGGHSATVYLSAQNLPAGVSASFDPQQVTAGTLVSNLTLSASSTATHGSYSFIVNGFDGQFTRTATIPLYISPRFELLGQQQSISCLGNNYSILGTMDLIFHAPAPCANSANISITPVTPGVTIMGYSIGPNPAPPGTTGITYQLTASPCGQSGDVHIFEVRIQDGIDLATAFIDVFFI